MAADPAELVAELKKLRKGRGLQSPAIESLIGRALREICGIGVGDGPAIIRERVTDRLAALADSLPRDLALVVRTALALEPDVTGQFLHERIQWLAQDQDRDTRTIRRRVDEGLTRLAEAATRSADKLPDDHQEGWHVQQFEAVLRLDTPSPTCYERRIIVADRDDLDRITILYTVPRQTGDATTSHGMRVEIHYGARLVSQEKISDSLFRFVLQLPVPLARGDRHDHCVIVRLPETQPMRPHYLYVPERPCDRFQLRVRFRDGGVPAEVERVNGAFHRAIDESPDDPEMLAVDSVDEVRSCFTDLAPRLGYGLRWGSRDNG